jgi:hypothetical protein
MNTHPVQALKDLLRQLLKREPGSVRRPKGGAIEQLPRSHAVVLGSGNLASIYFTKWKERLTVEQVQEYFPRLIPGLLENQYIGFLMLESESHGPTIIGRDGTYYLAEDRIIGNDPLRNFGPDAKRQLIRESSFPHAPDILVNSTYNIEKDEVYAFEPQIGSHGGLGGDQTRPFILVPSHWEIDEQSLVGAERVHKILKMYVEKTLAVPKQMKETSIVEEKKVEQYA